MKPVVIFDNRSASVASFSEINKLNCGLINLLTSIAIIPKRLRLLVPRYDLFSCFLAQDIFLSNFLSDEGLLHSNSISYLSLIILKSDVGGKSTS